MNKKKKVKDCNKEVWEKSEIGMERACSDGEGGILGGNGGGCTTNLTVT